MNNLQFYLNKFPSSPDGNIYLNSLTIYVQYFKKSVCSDMVLLFACTDVYIESFHKEWKNDYKRLERVHSYIQWYVLSTPFDGGYVQSDVTEPMSSDSDDLWKPVVLF